MKTVKHIIKEGSRNHVLWWDSEGKHCSEIDCEINQKEAKQPTTALDEESSQVS